ncbi:unnamed protein product [Caenorhabditis auriculariae]|uniref:Uncharacterized protein n=1 Tax=Caenorhabditis auriculariae TaxID=2777116 RepID=A0A8S1H8V4_9PELO|nr:unnamed protein product [Caenorhabditis auriculariae]
MTDVMRDMIAELMGSQHVEEHGRPARPFDHHSVCRAYLWGCCPYELVPDSRLQGLVSCHKSHEPAHKADFDRAQKERDYFFDIDAFEILENAIKLVDVEIDRIRDKLEREARELTDTAEDAKLQRIAEIDEKIQKQVEEIEVLGNLGRIEESMRLSKAVEELRERKEELQAQTEVKVAGPGSNASRLRVCDDCGAQLNVMDHESRIADHYNGKMHLGMVECRERFLVMKETIDERRRLRREQLGEDRNRDDRRRSPRRDHRDRDRGDRKRSRSRDRQRDRDRRRSSRDRDDRRKGRDHRRDRDRDRRY